MYTMLNNCSCVNNMHVSLKNNVQDLVLYWSHSKLFTIPVYQDLDYLGQYFTVYIRKWLVLVSLKLLRTITLCISDFYIFIFDNYVYLLTMIAFVYAPIVWSGVYFCLYNKILTTICQLVTSYWWKVILINCVCFFFVSFVFYLKN